MSNTYTTNTTIKRYNTIDNLVITVHDSLFVAQEEMIHFSLVQEHGGGGVPCIYTNSGYYGYPNALRWNYWPYVALSVCQ